MRWLSLLIASIGIALSGTALALPAPDAEAAYARGDAAWLAGWSATPFTAAGETVAKDPAALKAMYKQLLSEAPGKRAPVGLAVLTTAGIRGKLGGLPPGGESSDMLYAVGKAGGDEFILLLKKSSQGWRVCGVDRELAREPQAHVVLR